MPKRGALLGFWVCVCVWQKVEEALPDISVLSNVSVRGCDLANDVPDLRCLHHAEGVVLLRKDWAVVIHVGHVDMDCQSAWRGSQQQWSQQLRIKLAKVTFTNSGKLQG